MTSISEYKTRIASTTSLQQIFKAQELIATSRITKARDKAVSTLPYASTLEAALKTVIQKNSTITHPFLKKSNSNNVGLVVISSDRGMAGSYNSSIIKLAEETIRNYEENGKSVKIYPVGKRASTYFRTHYGKDIVRDFVESSETPSFDFSQNIAKLLEENYLDPNLNLEEIKIVYTKFKNMVTQIPSINSLLPFYIENTGGDEESKFLDKPTSNALSSSFEFLPEAEKLLDTIIPKYISTSIFHLLLESAASETASRQRAMHTANDNANDLLEMLVRESNQVRQANITNELNEMASAAQSLAN